MNSNNNDDDNYNNIRMILRHKLGFIVLYYL